LKVKGGVQLFMGNLLHNYGASPAIWVMGSHSILPATRHM